MRATAAARVALLAAGAAALLAPACVTPRVREECVVPLSSSEQLPPDLRLRARMRVDRDDGETSLEALATRRGDELLVAGFSSFGTRIFTVVQQGRDWRVESPVRRHLGFSPAWVLDALHRALWLEPPMPAGTAPSLTWQQGGECVTDDFADGRRVRRVFRAARGGGCVGAAEVTVDYRCEGCTGGDADRPIIEVRSRPCGYALQLMPLSDPRPRRAQ